MIKQRVLLVAIFQLLFLQMKAQDDTHKPNASKGKAGTNTVNINPFTGTASANIPIYDYSVDGLNFPISVAYSAKGIRVDEIASPVGLGWDLIAGSTISREVKGIEDEITSPATYKTTSDHYEGYLVTGSHSVNYTGAYFDDTTADIFHLNLAGRSLELTFHKSSSGSITHTTFPKSEIGVTIYSKDWNGSSFTNSRSGIVPNISYGPDTNFLSFVITDEHNNLFYFERGDMRLKDYEFDTTKFNNGIGTYWSTENWVLTKVQTAGGKFVYFDYQRKYVQYLETVTETFYTQRACTVVSGAVTFDPLQIKNHYWKGYKAQIATISYPNNTQALFQSDTSRFDCMGNYRLNNIKIKNQFTASSGNLKEVSNFIQYDFTYFMFNTPYYGITKRVQKDPLQASYYSTLNSTLPSGSNKDSLIQAYYERGIRLGLSKITRKGTDNSSTEPYYTFCYDTAHTLPRRFAPNKDYYGYYNGKANVNAWRYNPLNSSQVDTFELSIPYRSYSNAGGFFDFSAGYTFGQDRGFDADYAKTYSLNKITNGCMGSDSLIYSDYSLTNPDSAYGATTTYGWNGLEPYVIINYALDADMEGGTVNDGLVATTIISKDGFSVDNITTTIYSYASGVRYNQGGYMWYYGSNGSNDYVYSNYFVGPNEYYNGSNHGFSEVAVTKYGYNSQMLSYSYHYFSNLMYYDGNGNHKSCMSKFTGVAFHGYVGTLDKWRLGILQVSEYRDQGMNLRNHVVPEYEEVSNYGMRLLSNKSTNHIVDRINSTDKTSTSYTKYWYDANDNVVRQSTLANPWDSLITLYKYDNNQNIIATETWKRQTSASDSIFMGTTVTPVYSGTKTPYVFNSALKAPLSSSDAAPSNTTYINRACSTYNGTTPSSFGSNLILTNKATLTDSAGNFIEVQKNNHDEYVSTIWDLKTGHKMAEAVNTRYSDIAYTSFDGMYKPYCPSCSPAQTSLDYSKGNWEFYTADMIHVSDMTTGGAPVTGNYVYELKSGNYLRTQELTSTTYLLSFWCTDATPPTIALYSGSTSMGSVTATQQVTIGAWKLYKASFAAASGYRLKFTSSTSTYLDEVRLHPVGTAMKTYTYTPIFGLSSSTDANNYITYYEYTPFGKLTNTKDMRGNIIQKLVSKCSSTDLPGEGTSSTDPESNNNNSNN